MERDADFVASGCRFKDPEWTGQPYPSIDWQENLEWLRQSEVEEVEILTPKAKSNIREQQRQANINAARYRYYDAVEKCKICQEIKSTERFIFMYIPMTVFSGGISLKGTAVSYAGKATVSIGTQVAVSQDVNLIKLAGDTVFNPISGAVFGNSGNISLKALILGKQKEDDYSISSGRDFSIGIGTDILFMGRNKGYERMGASGLGNSVIEIQSEMISQGISNGLQDKYGDKK